VGNEPGSLFQQVPVFRQRHQRRWQELTLILLKWSEITEPGFIHLRVFSLLTWPGEIYSPCAKALPVLRTNTNLRAIDGSTQMKKKSMKPEVQENIFASACDQIVTGCLGLKC